jgi:deoxyribonuclease V
LTSYAAVDVGYPDTGGATAALVLSDEPTFGKLTDSLVVHRDEVAPYRPGAFYERELPPLLAVVAMLDSPPDLLVVDGYVTLDPAGRPGLGAHAHEALGVPVIGVAKTAFRGATHAVPVLRGGAQRPLFVTAVGLPVDEAAHMVRAMSGQHRLPEALRRVDMLSRRLSQ